MYWKVSTWHRQVFNLGRQYSTPFIFFLIFYINWKQNQLFPWLHEFCIIVLLKVFETVLSGEQPYIPTVPCLEENSLKNYKTPKEHLKELDFKIAVQGKLKHSYYKFLNSEFYNRKRNWPWTLILQICSAKKHDILSLSVVSHKIAWKCIICQHHMYRLELVLFYSFRGPLLST